MENKTIKKFYSKRNDVTLIEREGVLIVKKQFATKRSYNKELRELIVLQGKAVPNIVEYGDKIIYIEYIDGELLLDKFLLADNKELKRIAELFANFIKSYCAIRRGKALGDVNFRNYIIKNDKIYGVDFENVTCGNELNTLSKSIAFAMLYDADKERKQYFCECLANNFNYKKTLVIAVNKEIKALGKRRNKDYSNDFLTID